jgi:NitT/TauT family transport system ATP-binding protein
MRVRCTNLWVSFRDGGRNIQALQNLDFECADGEFLSILGPSGCGKTTLLRVLAGIVPPENGSVETYAANSNGNRRKLLVFQEESLFPWMTVLENAAFGLEMQGIPKPAREERARSLLDRMGVSDREHSYPHQLSLGMKQ